MLKPKAKRASAICTTQREAIARAKVFSGGHYCDVERVRHTAKSNSASVA